MVNAYKQFGFFNGQNRSQTIPTTEKLSEVVNSVSTAQDKVASSTAKATKEIKEQTGRN